MKFLVNNKYSENLELYYYKYLNCYFVYHKTKINCNEYKKFYLICG